MWTGNQYFTAVAVVVVVVVVEVAEALRREILSVEFTLRIQKWTPKWFYFKDLARRAGAELLSRFSQGVGVPGGNMRTQPHTMHTG